LPFGQTAAELAAHWSGLPAGSAYNRSHKLWVIANPHVYRVQNGDAGVYPTPGGIQGTVFSADGSGSLQNITGLSLQIGGLAKNTIAQPLRDRLESLGRDAEECLREARQSVWNLRRQGAEPHDLVRQLRDCGERLASGKPLRFSLRVRRKPRILPENLEQHMLRIGQEAIMNAIRHSNAKEVIIAFSALDGEETIYRALQAGATTYLSKETTGDEIVKTIRQVHAGKRPMPSQVASKLAERVARPSLTARELEVLRLVAQGLRNKEIGSALGIT
jgi:hypothetical protein